MVILAILSVIEVYLAGYGVYGLIALGWPVILVIPTVFLALVVAVMGFTPLVIWLKQW